MATINQFYFENTITGARYPIPMANIIPNIIPTAIISDLILPFVRNTNFHEIGIDPYPHIRKNFVVHFDVGYERSFPESVQPHRTITIEFPVMRISATIMLNCNDINGETSRAFNCETFTKINDHESIWICTTQRINNNEIFYNEDQGTISVNNCVVTANLNVAICP